MRLLSSLAALAVAACLVVVPVSAAVAAPEPTPGADVSYPQCDEPPLTTTKPLPTTHAFGIVGVNGINDKNLGNTTNLCLSAELTWASSSSGSGEQPTTSLYVMAQDPGTGGSWWPRLNRTRSGRRWPIDTGRARPARRPGPALTCMATRSRNWTRSGSAAPAGYFWWIDVEEGGVSWLPDVAVNNAAIEGMVAGFAAAGAATGLYSTTTQWRDVAGTTSTTSPLAGLPNWVPGAPDQASATTNCGGHAFTPNSTIAVAQYLPAPGDQDYDVSCARLASTPTPTLSGTAAVNQTLTAHPGVWWPTAVTLQYSWTRNGTAIAGATAPTYRTVAADAGQPIRVIVTGSGIARTSAAAKIPVPVSKLTQPHTLSAGQTLLAPNGRYRLTQQSDGNLVLYKDTGKAIWNTHTFGKGYRTTMQSDGNLVVYTSTHHAVWASRTYGKHATSAVMQSDGNFVLYTSAGKAVWATRTNGK